MSQSLSKALSLHKNGELKKAEYHYLNILKNNFSHSASYLLGLLYSQTNCYIKAIHYFEQSTSNHINDAEFYHALAICYQKLGKLKAALRLINIATSKNSGNRNYCNRKSKILLSAKRYEACALNSLKCIVNNPDFFPAFPPYITACNFLMRPDKGLRILIKYQSFYKLSPEYHFLLAECYIQCGKHNKARSIFYSLIDNEYKIMECLNNIGNIERDVGDTSSAREFYLKAHSLASNNPIIKLNLALLDLLEKKYKSGWINYESRLSIKFKSSYFRGFKMWNGENLNNKTLLIIQEQGIGDEILFSRSFDCLITIAKQVIILTCDRLHDIFSQSFPKAKVITRDKDVLKLNIDYTIYSGSIFSRTKNYFPNSRYLKSKPVTDNNTTFKIGFSWKGGSNFKDALKRSTHLREWQSLFTNNNISFYCLQHNISDCDRNFLSRFDNIIFLNTPAENISINQLALVISEMNLVISVTNTTVHLAGALGVKTWCLTPHNPDWPWGLEGENCDWYKSVKIFRKTGKNWNDIFREVEHSLNKLVTQ